MYAMQIGRVKAKGAYIVHMDSDEVLTNKKSFESKVNIFLSNNNIKAVLPSGLRTPSNISSVNYFINEFGEPFSYFIYRISINADYFIGMVKKYAFVEYEDNNYVVLNFSKTKVLPPIELAAIGIMIDRKYIMKNLPELTSDPKLLPLSFFYLAKRGVLFGFLKNDPIEHYSVAQWGKYLKKIKFRIVNNVYGLEMSKAGFSGRGEHYHVLFRLKKYLFIPYSLTIAFPLVDSLYLAITRKKLVFLAYPFLCLYISFLAVYYYLSKLFGIVPVQKGYGS